MGSSSHKRPSSRSRSPSSRDTKHRRRHRSHSRSRDINESGKSEHDQGKSKDRSRKRDRDGHRDERRDDPEREERRRQRRDEKRQTKHKEKNGLKVVNDDDSDDGWVEKDTDQVGIQNAVSTIPTRDSLPLRSNVSTIPPGSHLNASIPVSNEKEATRDSWMMEPFETVNPPTTDTANGDSNKNHEDGTAGDPDLMGDVDFFSGMGTARKKQVTDKPDPDKLVVSRFELNQQLKEGKTVDEYAATEKKKIVPGSSGSQWRMMKLRKVYEQASEESRSVEEIAMERYGNMDDFEEALEERRVLDERDSRRSSRRQGRAVGGNDPSHSAQDNVGGRHDASSSSGFSTPGGLPGGRKFMFTSDEGASSRPSSRAGFRRPGEEGKYDEALGLRGSGGKPSATGGGHDSAGFSTPTQPVRPSGRFNQSKSSTPIPSVLTPHHLLQRNPLSSNTVPLANQDPDTTASKPPLSLSELNALQAKVLRAKLSNDPHAAELEAEYKQESERRNKSAGGGGDQGGGLWTGNKDGVEGQLGRDEDAGAQTGGSRIEVQVLPTLDAQGRLYDVGTGDGTEKPLLPGNRRPKLNGKFETRDSKTGEVTRYNADDDSTTLGELVRQERFGAGSSDQKSMDASMATAIMGDAKYENDLDYMDDNVERLARRKMKNDAMKRAFAVNDYARTKKALDTCPYCFPESGPPKAPIVAIGHRAYLSCTLNEELVDGHCLIVPVQHYTSTLDLDDDEWEEIKNFMKCLMQMFAQQNKGVVFFETVLPSNIKYHAHTAITAIPLPAATFSDAPAYFRESILASESEWSQHKKLIDFADRPGGFRRSLTSRLPYFMVQFDHKGERGYGHVIEGSGEGGGGVFDEDQEGIVDEGEKGGGEYTRYFGHEIIGNLLNLPSKRWRKPRRIEANQQAARKAKLGNEFQPFNWTLQLAQQ